MRLVFRAFRVQEFRAVLVVFRDFFVLAVLGLFRRLKYWSL